MIETSVFLDEAIDIVESLRNKNTSPGTALPPRQKIRFGETGIRVVANGFWLF
jgi:hypothetical protein